MNRQWKVLFYRTIKGDCPIETFLNGLKKRERSKALAWIGLLQEHGINLHRPFADLIEDGIHELRMKITGNQIRVLYFFCFKDLIVLTHDFIKTENKVPVHEINLAKKYRADFLNRYNEETAGRL